MRSGEVEVRGGEVEVQRWEVQRWEVQRWRCRGGKWRGGGERWSFRSGGGELRLRDQGVEMEVVGGEVGMEVVGEGVEEVDVERCRWRWRGETSCCAAGVLALGAFIRSCLTTRGYLGVVRGEG